eukprot:TRINITY_DN2702_c0_g1_i1.p1 TRINITY_DN2702_c0_g1~~TRINITY_DN2702_c0_g1_i1.p1  ORF type:complete len:283 (-),score=57.28 TRINITY_DN2702_c0_g1_i1:121-969(-)
MALVLSHLKPKDLVNIMYLTMVDGPFDMKALSILVNHPGSLPETFLFKKLVEWAIKEDQPDWASKVLYWTSNESGFASSALRHAIDCVNLHQFQIISDDFIDREANFNSLALVWEARAGNLDRVKELIKDPSMDPKLALCSASSSNRVEVVKFLLSEPRIDPSIKNGYCFKKSAFKGYFQVLDLLVKDGRLVDLTGEIRNTCMNMASINGDTKTMRVLLELEGFDSEWTRNMAILAATLEEDEELLQMLRSHPSFANAKEAYEQARKVLKKNRTDSTKALHF